MDFALVPRPPASADSHRALPEAAGGAVQEPTTLLSGQSSEQTSPQKRLCLCSEEKRGCFTLWSCLCSFRGFLGPPSFPCLRLPEVSPGGPTASSPLGLRPAEEPAYRMGAAKRNFFP